MSRAPDPAAPPPVSLPPGATCSATVGAMMLLTAMLEAGAAKAAELDGELLASAPNYIEWTRAERAAWDAMTEGERQADICARPRPWTRSRTNKTPDKMILAQIARRFPPEHRGGQAPSGVGVAVGWRPGRRRAVAAIPREFSV